MDDFENKLTEIHDRVLNNALTEEEQNNYTESLFESIKHINEYGEEFWYARELQIALEYTQWRRFNETIERAKTACKNSGNSISAHFADVGKSSPMPNGGERILVDVYKRQHKCSVFFKPLHYTYITFFISYNIILPNLLTVLVGKSCELAEGFIVYFVHNNYFSEFANDVNYIAYWMDIILSITLY